MNDNNYTRLFPGFSDRRVCMNIVLDKRTRRKDAERFPVVARFTYGKQVFYKTIGGSHTQKEFSEICQAKKCGTEAYNEKKRWETVRETYRKLLAELNPGEELSMELVKALFNPKAKQVGKNGTMLSFLSLWKEIISSKSKLSYGNGEVYQRAYNSFITIVGKDSIKGFDINIKLLQKWEKGMMDGVIIEGELKGKVKDTTRGIYLTHCRAVWYEAAKRGFFHGIECPFSSKKEEGKIYIPKPDERHECFVDAEKMTELYDIFKNKRYPEVWTENCKLRAHYYLGLFLVQYLGNGMNLADVGLLEYNSFYYASGRKAFAFVRVKIKNRCVHKRKIIVPITDELRYVINEIAASEVEGTRVFPDILRGAVEKTPEYRKRNSYENANVRKYVRKVASEILGWDEKVSGAWARHSYATNLRNASVDKDYISDCMGHSIGRRVTDFYLGDYPLKTLLDNNSKLLCGNNDGQDNIDSLSREELLEYIKKQRNNK